MAKPTTTTAREWLAARDLEGARKAAEAFEAAALGLKLGGEAAAHQALVDLAAEMLAAYPQYAGYHTSWVVGRVSSRLRTKGGVAFEPGDVVLYRIEGGIISEPRAIAFSWRLGWHVSGVSVKPYPAGR